MNLSDPSALVRLARSGQVGDGTSDPFGFRIVTDDMLGTPVIGLFAAAVRAHPGRVALHDGSATFTYQETWASVLCLARRIVAVTSRDDLVGILLPNGAGYVIATMACLAAGRACVHLNSDEPEARLQQVLTESGLVALVGHFDEATGPAALAGITRIDATVSGPGMDTVPMLPTPSGADEPALVLYTSGSSGRPKGLVISQRALLRRVQQFVNAGRICGIDRLLSLSADSTIVGVRDRLTALITGATLFLVDARQTSPRHILAEMRRHGVTVTYAVPALMRSITQLAGARAPDSLRLLRVGGDALLGADLAMLRAWLPPSCLIQHGYGSTEMQVVQWFIPPDFPTDGGKVPAGWWEDNGEMSILDDDGRPVPRGELGEVVVHSPYVALARRAGGAYVTTDFPTDPADANRRTYRTGDLARVRPDGLLECAGRRDRQIKIRGQRVEPGEVEAAILRWPGIHDAVVMARRDGEQTLLIAYAVGDLPPAALAGLHAHLRDHLPAQLRPHRIYAVAELPRLPSAKIDAAGLQALDRLRQQLETGPVAPARHGPASIPFERITPDMLGTPVIELVAASVRLHSDRIAIDDGSVRLTYRQAWDSAQRLAHRIAAATAPGDLVGLLLPNCAAFPVSMLACLASGRVCVPLDANDPAARLQQIQEEAGLALLVGCFAEQPTGLSAFEGLPRIEISRSGALSDAGPDGADAVPLTPCGPDEPALVLYTSGSSGRPKGIVNSQRAVLRRVEQFVNAARISSADRILSLSSDCTIAGVRDRLTALVTGATTHLIDAQRSGPRGIVARMRQDGVTIAYAVPALMRAMIHVAADGPAPETLRVVRLGGETVLGTDVELLRAWLPASCLIQSGFGSTETQVVQWFIPPHFPTTGSMPVGWCDNGDELRIVDEDDRPVAPGEVGEVVVRSAYVALARRVSGSYVRTDFPPDPANPGIRTYRTGDLARVRADGLLELAGRRDRQIQIRGVRVEPGEVEAAILRWPGIRDAAVMGRRIDGEMLLIAYAVGSLQPDSIADLHAHLRARLPTQFRPHRIYLVAELPRLPSAKIDAAALRAMDDQRCRTEAESSRWNRGQNAIEQAVAAVWHEVLKRSDIDRDANFFDSGGDSLSAISVIVGLEAALGIELPITVLSTAPTIGSLAAAITDRTTSSPTPLVLLKPGEDGPPLFIVHGVGGSIMELFPLGRSLNHRGPVYAVQSRGVDGREPPIRSVMEMARHYWAAIRQVQPAGPYLISGYSFGGLVAFEIARLIQAEGEQVGMLLLIDSTTNIRRWPNGLLLTWLGARVMRDMRKLLRSPFGLWRSEARQTADFVISRLQWRFGSDPRHSGFLEASMPSAIEAVARTNLVASSDYHPGVFPGKMVLIRSALGSPYMCDPQRLWRRHAAALQLHTVPGTHVAMVREPNVGALATVVDECLIAAAARS